MKKLAFVAFGLVTAALGISCGGGDATATDAAADVAADKASEASGETAGDVASEAGGETADAGAADSASN